MQESDITKMKVADLKRELKNRGLPAFGNKNELMERLQAAFVDGIEGDELRDDFVLTDEDEANILGDDDNDLLQSPSSLKIKISESKDEDDLLLSPTISTASKKIVLKRKNSFKDLNEPQTTKENTQPTAESKLMKMSERNPITIQGAESASKIDPKANVVGKLSQLTEKERLEMRAKKFGQSVAATKPVGAAVAAITTNNTASPTETIITSNEQMEKLKKRAERFGVVSPTMAKKDENERLLKRKERFGGGAEAKSSIGSVSVSGGGNDVWAEKARQRLERFKTSEAAAASVAEQK